MEETKRTKTTAQIQEVEKDFDKIRKTDWALKLHLMPPVGWLNDPNGLCQMNGKYHIFFQYSPFNADGGDKYWGHFESTDLIHFSYTGAPLAPDTIYDKDGVYSGCSLVDDGVMKLYYTGNVKEDGDYDYIMSGRGANTILVETTDGIHMSSKKCLMTNADYPDYVTCHVRDPKVFKENGTYYMVQGAWRKDSHGLVLVFSSEDGIHWKHCNDLTTEKPFGYMWECPTLFSLKNQRILSVSPQGLESEAFRYQNIFQSGYFLLDGDFASSDYSLSPFEEWDMGFDFYAPQIFEDEKGRQLLIGWMGIPNDDYHNPTVAEGWQHALTIPRELTLSADRTKVLQNPVEEMEALRAENQNPAIRTSDYIKYDHLSLYELLVNNINGDFSMTIAEHLHLDFSKKKGVFTLSFDSDMGCGRDKRQVLCRELKNIQLFADSSAIEVSLNQGAIVMSSRFYPDAKTHSLEIHCSDCFQTLWKLNEITTTYASVN